MCCHPTDLPACLCIADRSVLQRIKEYLDILCTRLERVEGLICEDYIPETDAKKLWKPAPGSVVSYGEPADTAIS